jgi:7-keto-8-aminopelargonate synthetase-like enzyme
VLREAAQLGLGHLTAQDEHLNGRTIRINGKEFVHFGSCSYLGLELDPRLKQGAIEAVTRFGAHFSSSRAYVSAPLYAELEELVERIFCAPVVIPPTTTLGHLAALPVLCEEGDALLIDHQAHHSLRMAANQVRAQGARIESVPHNRLDCVEDRIEQLGKQHRRVWYLADGVYGMHGDLAPVEHLGVLLDRYEQLHAYLDDAHGVSWCGEHGKGYVLSQMPLHERMVVATTLGKSFGAGGAVLVFPNAEWRRRVRTLGGPMVFSGPVPPPVLGSAIVSARIHLSDELLRLQEHLRERVAFCNELLRLHGLPFASESGVPVRFVGTSLPSVAQALGCRLMEEGFYTNAALFPAVPMKGAGIRFTLTLHQSLDDIRQLVEAFARHLPPALARAQVSLEEVWRALSLSAPAPARHSWAPAQARSGAR